MEADGAAAAAAAGEASTEAGARPLAPEEEALRRNTDCVYFLASPLTCKKVCARSLSTIRRLFSLVYKLVWFLGRGGNSSLLDWSLEFEFRTSFRES
jgi:hypothetical protein